MGWHDVAHSLRGALNVATQETTEIILRSADHQCWRCGRPDQVPTVLHLAVDDTCYSGFQASAEPALPYVHELLTAAGHPAATAIKPRYSKTAGTRYLSLGCASCDAIYGAFPLSEDFLTLETAGELSSLPISGRWERPIIEWWVLEGLRFNL